MPSSPPATEVNLVGLPGPSHNFGGLAYGNLASMENRLVVSHPKQAALQVLEMMRRLHQLGIDQIFAPPHERPDLKTLRRLGFHGSAGHVIEQAAKNAPEILRACYSSSAMWMANAATVCPSADSSDGRVHFIPANLTSQLHRSIEPPFTSLLLQRLFSSSNHFAHHPPLPATPSLSDEGAANHMRLAPAYGSIGLHCFVFGRPSGSEIPTTRFTPRQAENASYALARLPGLGQERTFFPRQHPDAIDGGVFHNDVIAVSNANLLLCHTQAYRNPDAFLAALQKTYTERCNDELTVRPISHDELSFQDAVKSYVFNSQLIQLSEGTQAVIAPFEARDHPPAHALLNQLKEEENPIRFVDYVDLRESMRNGGGPACLRLRVALTETERAAVPDTVFFTEARYHRLRKWIEAHYRDRLHVDDLRDPRLIQETHAALHELSQMLDLQRLYAFQS